MESVRIDKWLWAVRLFKTRQLAADACRFSRIQIAGHEVKAAREVRPGEVITVALADITRTFRVLAVLEKRVGAALVREYVEELTPPEEVEAARRRAEERTLNRLSSPPLKPGKRDRRVMTAFLEEIRKSRDEE